METKEMESLYSKIAKNLVEMIPEDWTRLAMYAEVSDSHRKVYFYYFPKQSEVPLYSLDITEKFVVNQSEYDRLEDALYDQVLALWEEFQRNDQEQWTSLTIHLNNTGKFKLKYSYDDLSEVDTFERRVIWKYENLGLRTEGDRATQILNRYLNG